MSEHRAESAHIDKKRLAIEEERFALEQQKMTENTERENARLQLEKERNAREEKDANQRRLFDMLKKYHELRNSEDELDKMIAKKLAKEIAEAQGFQ